MFSIATLFMYLGAAILLILIPGPDLIFAVTGDYEWPESRCLHRCWTGTGEYSTYFGCSTGIVNHCEDISAAVHPV